MSPRRRGTAAARRGGRSDQATARGPSALPREPEEALPHDVPLDLGGAGGDRQRQRVDALLDVIGGREVERITEREARSSEDAGGDVAQPLTGGVIGELEDRPA